ncbi:MAG: PIN domain-containing protein [Lachnospiraceae bacterium]|nr:PIN domain-containing protein [Lachnospiraceae bacterium]
MAKYLLDTNAYFEILKYVVGQEDNEIIRRIINEKCYISKLTKIEIISVIGKYSRGQSKQIQICDRVHEDSADKCGRRYVIAERRKWNSRKLRDWMKLEKEITNGTNEKIKIEVLEINPKVVSEAERFIQHALKQNFKSMDAMILGTASAYSEQGNEMIVVTADKGLKAGMNRIGFSYLSLV